MQSYHKRILLAIIGIIAIGISLAALMSLGYAGRSGPLGGSATVAPYRLEPGKGLYLLSYSGEIRGDFRGDLRIRLEGNPAMDYRLVNLGPLRFLGQNQGKGLQDAMLVGLKPGDKLALLVLMQPRLVKVKGFEVPIASCCVPIEARSNSMDSDPSRPLTLSFIDAASDEPLRQVAIEFQFNN